MNSFTAHCSNAWNKRVCYASGVGITHINIKLYGCLLNNLLNLNFYRTQDTLLCYYVRSGQTRADQILANARSQVKMCSQSLKMYVIGRKGIVCGILLIKLTLGSFLV